MILIFIVSYENNCLLSFLVGDMVQLFHHIFTVSCHGIRTLSTVVTQWSLVYMFFALSNNIYWN